MDDSVAMLVVVVFVVLGARVGAFWEVWVWVWVSRDGIWVGWVLSL